MGTTFIWILIQRNTYVCARYCYFLCVHVFTYVWGHACRDMCMCIQGVWEKGGEPQVSFPTPPPTHTLWGRILTSLNRLDRLFGEHQGLADLHLPKLGLQMMHPTMSSYFFFNVASVDWTQALVICQHLANKAISSPAPVLLLLLFF